MREALVMGREEVKRSRVSYTFRGGRGCGALPRADESTIELRLLYYCAVPAVRHGELADQERRDSRKQHLDSAAGSAVGEKAGGGAKRKIRRRSPRRPRSTELLQHSSMRVAASATLCFRSISPRTASLRQQAGKDNCRKTWKRMSGDCSQKFARRNSSLTDTLPSLIGAGRSAISQIQLRRRIHLHLAFALSQQKPAGSVGLGARCERRLDRDRRLEGLAQT